MNMAFVDLIGLSLFWLSLSKWLTNSHFVTSLKGSLMQIYLHYFQF